MSADHLGTTPGMAENPTEDTTTAEDLIEEPTEHLSRPEQPDFDPEEKERYDDPDVLPTNDD